MAMMISGVMAGKSANPSSAPPSRDLRRAMPTAPSVPSTAEIRQLYSASCKLCHRASRSPLVS